MRLDAYLAEYWPEYSRSQWQKYITAGYVQVNGVVVTVAKTLLGEDDEVTQHVPSAPNFEGQSLPVIYQDDHVVVINKPSGILTHAKGAVTEEFTVADFVRPKLTEPDETNRPGIVHRLDRETSGVIICAKDRATKGKLQKQFQIRLAKKTYLALVSGRPKHHTARIELPIERNPKAPASFRVGANGKFATTNYRVLKTDGHHSLVELRPETGRTHQLRVHMAYIGCPILGDKLYGGGESPLGRLCLHAQALEITIPDGDRRTFRAELPEDFSDHAESMPDDE